MDKEKEERQVYLIPENFIAESRIFSGAVRTRYFIEACVLTLIVIIPALGWEYADVTKKVSTIVLIGIVPFAIGIMGIMGDPVSIFLKSSVSWLKNRKKYLVDTAPHPLNQSPLETKGKDNVVQSAVHTIVETTKEKRTAIQESSPEVEYEVKMDQDLAGSVIDIENKDIYSDIFTYIDATEQMEDDSAVTLEVNKPIQIVVDEEAQNEDIDELRKELFGFADEEEN